MTLNKSAYYLLRIDYDSFVVTGEQVSMMMDIIHKDKMIRVTDIANNFLMKPYKNDTMLSIQELYDIELIKLK